VALAAGDGRRGRNQLPAPRLRCRRRSRQCRWCACVRHVRGTRCRRRSVLRFRMCDRCGCRGVRLARCEERACREPVRDNAKPELAIPIANPRLRQRATRTSRRPMHRRGGGQTYTLVTALSADMLSVRTSGHRSRNRRLGESGDGREICHGQNRGAPGKVHVWRASRFYGCRSSVAEATLRAVALKRPLHLVQQERDNPNVRILGRQLGQGRDRRR